MAIERVAVYCGSRTGDDPSHRSTAALLGEHLADHGIELVYGGGHIGLMGVVADAALARGGTVTGVITEALDAVEVAHRGLTKLVTVISMHERKLAMSELADAFVMLPGGFGTLDEFFEAITWTQLGIHNKPCGILDPTGYYQPLLALLDQAVEQGFLSADHRRLVLTATEPGELLGDLRSWEPLDPSSTWPDRPPQP